MKIANGKPFPTRDVYQFHTHPKPTKGKEKVFIPKKIVCYRCGGVHLAPDCKFKNAECHICKKGGHIARACRRKPTQTGFQDKRLKDHHYLEDEVQDTAASQKQSKEHPYPLFNMDSNEHKHSWWMLILTKCQCQWNMILVLPLL